MQADDAALITALRTELGDLYVQLEDYEQAASVYEAVLDELAADGPSRNYAETLRTLADMQLELENPASAAELYVEAAEVWSELDAPDFEEAAVAAATSAYIRSGQMSEAATLYDQLLDKVQAAGDSPGS